MTESPHPLKAILPPPRCYLSCRYSAQMLQGRLYTPEHYWMQQESPGVWRVGLTPWLLRVLGDLESCTFDLAPNSGMLIGRQVGAIRGINGVIKVRAVTEGTLIQFNPMLAESLEAMAHDCCGSGWLYLSKGMRDPNACDVMGYRRMLDEAMNAVCGAGPTLQ